MQYFSTRGKDAPQKFTEILLGGLAKDGGLYLPAHYPQIAAEQLQAWQDLSYSKLAESILAEFIDDLTSSEIEKLCSNSYQAKIFPHARNPHRAEEITPITTINEDFSILELSNGPTLAFKDMAMQLLGNLFQLVLEKKNSQLNILGATSGDTGSAAEYAMRGKASIKVFMLSPAGKMSAFQRAQMYSLNEANIHNIAVKGVFDQAQDIVKELNNDLDFKEKYQLGAVNSINWARILAQIVYYFKAYLAIRKKTTKKISFSVPSGNFGNICAGHIARMMGLPIHRLILATNENNVLDEFFKTGIYRPRSPQQTFITSSPSMDISKASNFERFIFDLVERDVQVLNALWRELDERGSFDLSGSKYFANIAKYGFVSGASNHQQRLNTISKIWHEQQILIDTHTADGYFVAEQIRQADEHIIVLETAQAIKFGETIEQAIGEKPKLPAAFAALENLPQYVTTLPADAQSVRNFMIANC